MKAGAWTVREALARKEARCSKPMWDKAAKRFLRVRLTFKGQGPAAEKGEDGPILKCEKGTRRASFAA